MTHDKTAEYLLGSKDNEIARLRRQHEVWSHETDALLAASGFGQNMRLLDLGCGPGFTSLRLAELVGDHGQVTGIDMSPRFREIFAELTQGDPRMKFVHGDVAEPHDALADAAFDGAYARWLFCFLPDPQAVLQAIHGRLRIGARIVIHDYRSYLSTAFQPPDPRLARGFEAVYQSFAASGGNLNIGDTLPTMLEYNGFVVEQLRPIQVIARPGEAHWRWFEDFHATHFASLVDGGLLSAEALAEFDAALDHKRQTPGSFFSLPPMIGIVARAN